MIASPQTLRRTLMGGLCVSALVMGACSGGDKTPAEEITVDAKTLNLTQADETALSRHFEIEARGGIDAETIAILKAAGFDNAVYETRQIEGSTIVFTGWTASSDDGVVKADRVEMIGLHDTEIGPTLDKLVVLDMEIDGYDTDDGNGSDAVIATVGNLTLVQPNPALFADLSEVLLAREGGSDSAVDTVGDLGDTESFRAFRIEDMTANVQEDTNVGTLSIGQIIVGQDPEDNIVDAVLESVDFQWKAADDDSDTEPFVLDMDGLTIMGLNPERMEDIIPQRVGVIRGFMAGALNTLTPSDQPPYRQVDLGQLSIVSSFFDLTTDGFEADTEKQGDKIILRTVTEPLLLTLKDVSQTPLSSFMGALKENGFAEISLQGSSVTTFDRKADRVTYEDNGTEIDEGLRLRCNYAVQGLRAAAEALEASEVKAPVFELSEDGNAQAAMDRYIAQADAYRAVETQANANIKLESLNCVIQDVADNSLVERAYAVASEITGRPVAVLKGGAKTAIALGSLTAPSEFQRDLMDVVGSGLIDFIDTPGQTLTLTIDPEAPVSILSLMGEDGAEPSIKPLNLSVEVR